MKKIIAVLTTAVILSVSMLLPAFAAADIVITKQPQNAVFPENSGARWSVEATGNDLSYSWFIVYQGVAYDTAKSFEEQHPWQDGVGGGGYGKSPAGNEFFIEGIGKTLDGAEIYCVISNRTGSVTSESAHISVGGVKFPPLLKVPAKASVEKGKRLELRCEAEAAEADEIKSYAWFETSTGELKDIVAIGAKEGKPENKAVLVCGTEAVGTRYYVCYVETKMGGKAYSSVIPVTVTAPTVVSSVSSRSEATGNTGSDDKTGSTIVSDVSSGKSAENESLPATGETENESDKTENLSDPDSTKKGLAPLWIVLIVIGGLAVVGGVVVIVISRKKNTPAQ